MKPTAIHKGLCTRAEQFGLHRRKEPLKSLRIRNLSCGVTLAKVFTPPGPGFCCCLFCLLLFIVRRMREIPASRGCEAAVEVSGLCEGRPAEGSDGGGAQRACAEGSHLTLGPWMQLHHILLL